MNINGPEDIFHSVGVHILSVLWGTWRRMLILMTPIFYYPFFRFKTLNEYCNQWRPYDTTYMNITKMIFSTFILKCCWNNWASICRRVRLYFIQYLRLHHKAVHTKGFISNNFLKSVTKLNVLSKGACTGKDPFHKQLIQLGEIHFFMFFNNHHHFGLALDMAAAHWRLNNLAYQQGIILNTHRTHLLA